MILIPGKLYKIEHVGLQEPNTTYFQSYSDTMPIECALYIKTTFSSKQNCAEDWFLAKIKNQDNLKLGKILFNITSPYNTQRSFYFKELISK